MGMCMEQCTFDRMDLVNVCASVSVLAAKKMFSLHAAFLLLLCPESFLVPLEFSHPPHPSLSIPDARIRTRPSRLLFRSEPRKCHFGSGPPHSLLSVGVSGWDEWPRGWWAVAAALRSGARNSSSSNGVWFFGIQGQTMTSDKRRTTRVFNQCQGRHSLARDEFTSRRICLMI